MKLIFALVMILGVLTSLIKAENPDCKYGLEYKKTREHKKKAAAFYK